MQAALAWAAVRYFQVVNPIELRVGTAVQIDATALGFGILLSLFTAVLFGLLRAIGPAGAEKRDGMYEPALSPLAV